MRSRSDVYEVQYFVTPDNMCEGGTPGSITVIASSEKEAAEKAEREVAATFTDEEQFYLTSVTKIGARG